MQKQPLPAMLWDLNQVPLQDIDLNAVRSREDLFYMVAGASFIEIAADLYTDNLIEYFNDQPEIMQWLADHWKPVSPVLLKGLLSKLPSGLFRVTVHSIRPASRGMGGNDFF